ncbi:MAG: hypothetical protein ACHREM_02270 [Polyangiales bacterium]
MTNKVTPAGEFEEVVRLHRVEHDYDTLWWISVVVGCVSVLFRSKIDTSAIAVPLATLACSCIAFFAAVQARRAARRRKSIINAARIRNDGSAEVLESL